MLISISRVCQAVLRTTDVFSRIGGEEFAILMPGTPIEGASILAERIRNSVAENKLNYKGFDLQCTISIGLAQMKRFDSSIEDCMDRADKLMYQAKEKGRNRVDLD